MSNEMELTMYADESFFDLLESKAFRDKPSDEIFAFLSNGVKLTPFNVFLKRLIFKKAGFSGKMEETEDELYRDYIVSSFRENNVPASFNSPSTKISAVSKNWLKAATVSRETVLLLGFGLKLTSAEVSELLTKGLNESKIYYRNSFEAICSYCYDNGFSYSKMRELTEKYVLNSETADRENKGTLQIGSLIKNAINDEELLGIMKEYKLDSGNFFSRTARAEFDRLYGECSEIVSFRKGFEDDEWDISAIDTKSRLTDSIKKRLKYIV